MRVLDGREYKLLLDPRRFAGTAGAQEANKFWLERIVPIIERRLGPRRSGKSRARKQFKNAKPRLVTYWDTSGRTLTASDYSLRKRERGEDGAVFTLKLRTPDQFITGGAAVPDVDKKKKVAFEEDIAPLEVAVRNDGSPPVHLATPRSFRSRFSLSSSQHARRGDRVFRLRTLSRLFRGLEGSLKSSGLKLALSQELSHGPVIREFVFEGATVSFGKGVTGKFAFTLWYFEPVAQAPNVAELSFRCRTKNGRMPRVAAQRAYSLFVGFQEDLEGWVNLRDTSKTELALPAVSGRAKTEMRRAKREPEAAIPGRRMARVEQRADARPAPSNVEQSSGR